MALGLASKVQALVLKVEASILALALRFWPWLHHWSDSCGIHHVVSFYWANIAQIVSIVQCHVHPVKHTAWLYPAHDNLTCYFYSTFSILFSIITKIRKIATKTIRLFLEDGCVQRGWVKLSLVNYGITNQRSLTGWHHKNPIWTNLIQKIIVCLHWVFVAISVQRKAVLWLCCSNNYIYHDGWQQIDPEIDQWNDGLARKGMKLKVNSGQQNHNHGRRREQLCGWVQF